MKLTMNLGEHSYDILIERGLIHRAGELLPLRRRVLVVTDDGVPASYAQTVAAQCKSPVVVTIPQGEDSKSFDTYGQLLHTMLDNGFDRSDAVVAVGGGVVGDLSGFAAASYMRGIDFYNVPTTLLSQVDSSIGGKTAVNFGGIKNIVGAFYQPKRVLIDPDVLDTLPPRQIAAGFAEGLKMAATSDPAFFARLESADWRDDVEGFLVSSLSIKKAVVEQDEKESGLRKLLNFGHTLGHGIESAAAGALFHGECVALGMLPMCSPEVRERLLKIYARAGLPTSFTGDTEAAARAILHDKKCHGDSVTVVTVPEIGQGTLTDMPVRELLDRFRTWQEGGQAL